MTVSFLYQEGKSALLRAAGTGDISVVKRELSGHTDVNCQDEVCIKIPTFCTIMGSVCAAY